MCVNELYNYIFILYPVASYFVNTLLLFWKGLGAFSNPVLVYMMDLVLTF